MKNALGLSLLLALGVTACNPIEEIEEEVDCNDLCNRYRTCYDEGYDVAACEDRCGEFVDGGDPAAANSCDACLDSNSCATTPFNCAAECEGLLP